MKHFQVVALLLWFLTGAPCPAAVLLQGEEASAQDPIDGSIEQARAALARPGPEGAEARQAAIENLLGMLEPKAHALLQEKLLQPPAADSLHGEILVALARHLRNPGDRVFGTGDENRELRQQIVRSYVPALASLWVTPAAGTEAAAGPLRDQARACVVRMPMRELDEGLRALVASPDAAVGLKVAAMAVAADGRDLYLANFLADHLEHADPVLRRAARAGLKLLTFAEEEFSTQERYREWANHNSGKRYLDLAEEAGRAAVARVQRLDSGYRERLQQGAVELVLALADSRPGVEWGAVQERVLRDEPPGTTEACLDRLRHKLQDDVHSENNTRERQAFHRALLEVLSRVPPAQLARRALLLETAAFLLRPGEGDLAAEMEKLLIQQLESGEPVLVQAAARGLRRFPSVASRTALVRVARAALMRPGEAAGALLREALRTLGRRSAPPWTAPGEADADKVEWLELVRALFASDRFKELRTEAMGMALLADSRGERVPEVFDVLMALAKDPQQSFEIRSASLIHLKDFLGKEDRADAFMRELTDLLGDPDKEIRLFVANQLTTVPDHSEAKRREWVQLILFATRERLCVEANQNVLRALLTVLSACARPPGTAEAAIGSLMLVLEKIGLPVPPEHQFRLEPVLQAITALAAEPMPRSEPWLGACRVLAQHDKRVSLRHVLQSQHAVQLAGETGSAEAPRAERARLAMQYILRAAVLKPQRESWSAPELKEEASDVRSAFAALDLVGADLDAPNLRMLRLEVLSALGGHQEVLRHGLAYLSPDDKPKNAPPLNAEQKDAARLLVAEAHLALGQLDRVAAMLAERDPARAGEAAALSLLERLGRAHLDQGAASQALPFLEKAWHGTAEGDPRYRARLLAFVQARLQAQPGTREEVAALLESKASLFEASDCPAELKEAFLRLRGQGN